MRTPDVFIAHHDGDKAAAQVIAAALQACGIRPMLAGDIRGRATYAAQARDAIRQAKATLALWSQRAVSSEECLEESSLALARGTLFAARIDRSRPPPIFKTVDALDLSDFSGADIHHPHFAALVQALGARMRKPVAAPEARPAQAIAEDGPVLIDEAVHAEGEGGEPPDLSDQSVRVTIISGPRLRDVGEAAPAPRRTPAFAALGASMARAGQSLGETVSGMPLRWRWGAAGAAAFVIGSAVGLMLLRAGSDGQIALTPRTSAASAADLAPAQVASVQDALIESQPLLEIPALSEREPLSIQSAAIEPAAAGPADRATGTIQIAATTRPSRTVRRPPVASAQPRLEQTSAPAPETAPPAAPAVAAPPQYDLTVLEPVVRQRVERARAAAAQARAQASRARSAAAGSEAWVAQTANGEYAGEWASGAANGFGVERASSGETYAGGWRGSRRHGEGVLNYANGCRYEGEFAEGRPTGRGAFWSAQGERLIGSAIFSALMTAPGA
ncbi:MAG: TIR domain-containing protein [Alphaproteobacteria bacterium]|nr:TIR domain-containing protein [Alphaproteobacteria bacterium]